MAVNTFNLEISPTLQVGPWSEDLPWDTTTCPPWCGPDTCHDNGASRVDATHYSYSIYVRIGEHQEGALRFALAQKVSAVEPHLTIENMNDFHNLPDLNPREMRDVHAAIGALLAMI